MRFVAVAAVGLLALTGCGKKDKGSSGLGGGGFVSGGGSGGVSSGASGVPTDLPTDLPSGVPSSAPSYGTPSDSPSTPSTYDPEGLDEVDGSNCNFTLSAGQLTYDVTITNADTTRGYRYSIAVSWNDPSGGLIGYRHKYFTVLANSTRTVTMADTTSYTKRTSITCQITAADKTPAS
ncbi:hypothetical protein [Streptomyces sp. ME19-01-6]|uniref:hypothetical protein n=1 Tax=Streptomyces sp. ME19-01-6 TaxID=3028686 RepID=UPI0029CA9A65|nr:hypothetical protein [Streptomyces sp. ME19-01-6]